MVPLAKQIADAQAQQKQISALGPEPAPIPYAMMDNAGQNAVPALVPAFAKQPTVIGPSPEQKQLAYTQAQLEKVREAKARPYGFAGAAPSPDFPTGLAPNHPGKLGHVLHALSVAGNIAGNIVAPGTMSLIPGTQLNLQDREQELTNRANSEIGQESIQENAQNTGELKKAQAAYNTEHAQEMGLTPITPDEASALGNPDWAGSLMNSAQRTALAKQASINQTKIDTQRPIAGADGMQYRIDPNNPGQSIPYTTPDGQPIKGVVKPVDTKKLLQEGVKKAMDEGNGPEAERLMTQLKAIDPLGWQNAQSRQTMAGASVSRAATAAGQLGLGWKRFGFDQEKFYNPQPVGAERTKGDLGKSAVARTVRMEDIVDAHPEIFGPGAGRATRVKQWIGSQSPDAQIFLTDREFLNDHAAGVFGGRGKYILQALNTIDDPKMNAAALHASLEEARNTSQGFVEAGTVHHGPQGGGNTGKKNDPLGIR